MNTIDSSHMEAVKNWLEDNTDNELRMKHIPEEEFPWNMMFINSTNGETTTWSAGKTFSDAIRSLSLWVGDQPRNK